MNYKCNKNITITKQKYDICDLKNINVCTITEKNSTINLEKVNELIVQA